MSLARVYLQDIQGPHHHDTDPRSVTYQVMDGERTTISLAQPSTDTVADKHDSGLSKLPHILMCMADIENDGCAPRSDGFAENQDEQNLEDPLEDAGAPQKALRTCLARRSRRNRQTLPHQ